MRHAEAEYRAVWDQHGGDALSWQAEDGDDGRVWLHAARDGEGEGEGDQTEWHVVSLTVAGSYDSQAEG